MTQLYTFRHSLFHVLFHYGLSQDIEGKASACNAGDPGSIPGLGRSPGEGNGNPLRYSCLENPMDGEACRLQSMMRYSVWGRKESDTTEQLHFHFTFTFIEYSSLCYIVGPCCLSILCIMVFVC